MKFSCSNLFLLIIVISIQVLNVTAQIRKYDGENLEKACTTGLQRHLLTKIKYPAEAERTYIQGNTVAYFKVNNRKIILLSVAPKLTIDFKNAIIRGFKDFKTKDLRDGFYGLPINFRIANVVTKILNEEIDVHPSYIDLPFLEILLGMPNCDPGASHLYCEPNTLHAPYGNCKILRFIRMATTEALSGFSNPTLTTRKQHLKIKYRGMYMFLSLSKETVI